MPAPQLPYTFAGASGVLNLSEFDANFTFLLNLILSGGSTPSISYAPPTLTGPVSAGSAAGTATISSLSGGSWSISTTADFQINPSTGAVTASTTVNGGTYPFTISYTGTVSGQTITVSLVTSIVVTGSVSPSLDFSQPSDSQFTQIPQGA